MNLCSFTLLLTAVAVVISLPAKLASAQNENGTSYLSSTCPENVASQGGVLSENRTTTLDEQDRFIEIEFKLKFEKDHPHYIDQGIRLEARLKSTDSFEITDWTPIRFYTPSIEEASDYRSLVRLDSSNNMSVTAEAGVYNSTFPLLHITDSKLVLIREYICGQLLQKISGTLQLELRWMQRFGRKLIDNNDSIWIFDDVEINIWNGTCFLQLLNEDFSGKEEVIFKSYMVLRGVIQQNVSEFSEISNFLLFNGFVRGITGRRSINIIVKPSNTSKEIVCTSSTIQGSGFCTAEKTVHLNFSYSWEKTEVGSINSVPCNLTSDVATRQCGLGGVWSQPNISLCERADNIISQVLTVAVTLQTVGGQLQNIVLALRITEADVVQQTTNVLVMVESFLTSVRNLFVSNTTVITFPVMMEIVNIISSLLQWEANLFKQTGTSSRIILSSEALAAQYAQSLLVNQSIRLSADNFILVAENLPLKTLQSLDRSISLKKDVAGDLAASITLPSSAFANISDRTQVGLFFARYQKSTIFPVRETETAKVADAGRTTIVGSSIIAATVVPELPFDNLQPPVLIILSIPTEINGSVIREGSEVCVSWDFSAAGNLGNWTPEGCVKVATNDGVVNCECDHLTNFAVLIDICPRVQPEGCMNSVVFDTALSAITYIGVTLSLIGLILTVITMLAFKKLRDLDVTKFHVQLFLAMIFMLVVFVAGVDRTEVVGGCIAASVLIHYFTLTSILWMMAEAILMLQKFVFVFQQLTKKGIIISSLVVWLTPLIAVGIPLIIDLANGNEATTDLIIRRGKFCFLDNVVVFWSAFLGPILAAILVNIVIFIIVIVVLVRQKRRMLSREKKHMDFKKVVLLVISLAGIMFLFGISWIFAAFTFSVQEIRKPSQVLFTVFNSFQGFFIFVFFCIISKETRDMWKDVLCCGKYKSNYSKHSMKFSNASSKYKDHSKNLKLGNPSSSDYTSENNLSTGIFSNNRKTLSETPLYLKYTSAGKKSVSEIEHEPTNPAREEKKEVSASIEGKNDGNEYTLSYVNL